MTITYHGDLIQGSEEWHQARCGLLTASEIKLILSPTLKIANNDKTRAHVWELAAQRITNFVEPTYIGDDMLRGHEDELYAREAYAKRFGTVEEVGFVTNSSFGFTLGCSPDGLVGDAGMIECKSRRQKYQIETLVSWFRDGSTPSDYLLQVQGAMLIAGRKWCDLVSYSGGLPMVTMRVFADAQIHAAILEAATGFEAQILEAVTDYHAAVASDETLIPTERRVEMEMF